MAKIPYLSMRVDRHSLRHLRDLVRPPAILHYFERDSAPMDLDPCAQLIVCPMGIRATDFYEFCGVRTLHLSRTNRLRSPHTQARWFEAELARSMRFLVFNFVHAHRILEYHTVGTLEVEEARPRRRMTPRAEHDRYALVG